MIVDNNDRIKLSLLLVEYQAELANEPRYPHRSDRMALGLRAHLLHMEQLTASCLKAIWEGTGLELTLQVEEWEHLSELLLWDDGILHERILEIIQD